MTTAPPGILTGKPALPGCRIAVPGFYHLNMIPAASDYEWTAANQRHDGDLVFGLTPANGAIRLHYDTAAQWRAAALAMNRIADWLEKIA